MGLFANAIDFDPAAPLASLGGLPESPGIFALYGANSSAEPYLSKTANLRRRLMRFLRGGPSRGGPSNDRSEQTGGTGQGEAAAPPASRRLQLAHLVRRIEYTVTGSEFESALCLYNASLEVFGDRARRRLRLRPPTFLRMSIENPYPRVYSTTRIAKAGAGALFGPFPSRAASERYAEEMLNLFLLRRCIDDLKPDPAFPGCPYSEMKMCLAPCYRGCSDERYREESEQVFEFLATRGASLVQKLEAERNAASEALEFERAAGIHQRIEKAEAAAHLASEAVRPLSLLNGILVQPAAQPACVALFRLEGGLLSGPALYSTVGMRLANERSGSTSLFAHPVAIEAVPLEGPPALSVRSQPNVLERRLDEALQQLEQSAPKATSTQVLTEHLALFTRWFYQPAARRVGEVLFEGSDRKAARKPLLRAISRVAISAAAAPDWQHDSRQPKH